MQQINQNIRWYRDYKRYTQQELADLLDTTVGRIKSYEGGAAVPPLDMLILLSEEMKLSIDALVKIELSETNYLGLRKDAVKEKAVLDSFGKISERLTAIEKKLKMGYSK